MPPERRCPFCNAHSDLILYRDDDRRCLACGKYWVGSAETSIRTRAEVETERAGPRVPDAVEEAIRAATREDTDDGGWKCLSTRRT